MDCSKPNGCTDPLDCTGDGTCNNEYRVENHELERADSYQYHSEVFGAPLELVLRDIMMDLATLEARLDSLAAKHAS